MSLAGAGSDIGYFYEITYVQLLMTNKACSVDKKLPIQDVFLNALREERIPVSIFLKNGIKLQGVIANFDSFIITLKNVTEQAVYKHAISTIMPSRDVRADKP